MSDGKTLSSSEYAYVRAFVNNLVSCCRNCNRRHLCGSCDLKNARNVLKVIDSSNGERPAAERAEISAIHRRMHRVISVIKDHGVCRSVDINTEGFGTKQNKWSTLHVLVKRGVLRIVKDEFGFKAYEIVPENAHMAEYILQHYCN